MISLELPENIAYSILRKELMGYRVLRIKDDTDDITTLIHIENMKTDEDGNLTADILQVQVSDDKKKDEIFKWYNLPTKEDESTFYDISLDNKLSDEDVIRRLNGLLLMLITTMETAEFRVSKTYDTDVKIN